MTETVTLRIGGENIAVPAILNFATLKRVWPALQARDTASDDVAYVSCSLAVLAAVLAKTRPELTQPVLEERLRVKRFDPATGDPSEEDERGGVIAAVSELLRASGLIPPKPPEPPAAPTEETASTETGIT